MNMKKFTIPRVFLTDAVPQAQPGSATAEPDVLKPVPLNFEEWLQSRWLGDFDGNGVDFDDYAKWWASNGFGPDTWTQYNPDVQWEDEWVM